MPRVTLQTGFCKGEPLLTRFLRGMPNKTEVWAEKNGKGQALRVCWMVGDTECLGLLDGNLHRKVIFELDPSKLDEQAQFDGWDLFWALERE